MPYSVDTSAFLDAWVRYYPPDVFPTIWEQMDRAANNGTLVASDEVKRELEKKDDGARQWVKQHPDMIVELDLEIERHVREIMERYPRLVDTKKGRSVRRPICYRRRAGEEHNRYHRRERNRQNRSATHS
jgi:hypothetical protein